MLAEVISKWDLQCFTGAEVGCQTGAFVPRCQDGWLCSGCTASGTQHLSHSLTRPGCVSKAAPLPPRVNSRRGQWLIHVYSYHFSNLLFLILGSACPAPCRTHLNVVFTLSAPPSFTLGSSSCILSSKSLYCSFASDLPLWSFKGLRCVHHSWGGSGVRAGSHLSMCLILCVGENVCMLLEFSREHHSSFI